MPPRSPYTAVKHVRLLPETLAYLDALALRQRTTSSALIRRAVSEWIDAERRGEHLPATYWERGLEPPD